MILPWRGGVILKTIPTAVLAFAVTNIDDIFILMLLFAQCGKNRWRITAGQYLGIGLLTAASLLGAKGLQLIPAGYIRFLGLVPILLGLRILLKKEEDEDEVPSPGLLTTAACTIANGADNLGVYIPLFTRFGPAEAAAAVCVFAVMTGLWCFLGAKLGSLPKLRQLIGKYRKIAVPAVFILLGLYILIA